MVADRGPGFPPGFDWQTAAHTGLELIEGAGRYDLQGTISYENRPEDGARVVVTFPSSSRASEPYPVLKTPHPGPLLIARVAG